MRAINICFIHCNLAWNGGQDSDAQKKIFYNKCQNKFISICKNAWYCHPVVHSNSVWFRPVFYKLGWSLDSSSKSTKLQNSGSTHTNSASGDKTQKFLESPSNNSDELLVLPGIRHGLYANHCSATLWRPCVPKPSARFRIHKTGIPILQSFENYVYKTLSQSVKYNKI